LRNDHFKRDAFQRRAACRFLVGIHVRILQVNATPERLQCAP
jgi:hypothetical protein